MVTKLTNLNGKILSSFGEISFHRREIGSKKALTRQQNTEGMNNCIQQAGKGVNQHSNLSGIVKVNFYQQTGFKLHIIMMYRDEQDYGPGISSRTRLFMITKQGFSYCTLGVGCSLPCVLFTPARGP